MLQSCFPVNNEVQTMFPPILIPDINSRELRNNVNSTSQMFIFSLCLDFFYVPAKDLGKVGEKQSIMSLPM